MVTTYKADEPALLQALQEALHPEKQHSLSLRVAFAVIGNTDEVEGKGAPVTRSYHFDVGEAQKAARGRGPSGGDAYVQETYVLVVCTPGNPPQYGRPLPPRFVVPVSDVTDLRPEPTLKAQALAKLTAAERKALGV